MDIRERYRSSLHASDASARDLLDRDLDVRQSIREAGLGRAMVRALLLPPLALFLVLAVRLQRRLLKL
jgi:hypothetical protein